VTDPRRARLVVLAIVAAFVVAACGASSLKAPSDGGAGAAPTVAAGLPLEVNVAEAASLWDGGALS
jgi:hypothetical protein